jgi:hypothetical protein
MQSASLGQRESLGTPVNLTDNGVPGNDADWPIDSVTGEVSGPVGAGVAPSHAVKDRLLTVAPQMSTNRDMVVVFI